MSNQVNPFVCGDRPPARSRARSFLMLRSAHPLSMRINQAFFAKESENDLFCNYDDVGPQTSGLNGSWVKSLPPVSRLVRARCLGL
jgi:hypothetical protein